MDNNQTKEQKTDQGHQKEKIPHLEADFKWYTSSAKWTPLNSETYK